MSDATVPEQVQAAWNDYETLMHLYGKAIAVRLTALSYPDSDEFDSVVAVANVVVDKLRAEASVIESRIDADAEGGAPPVAKPNWASLWEQIENMPGLNAGKIGSPIGTLAQETWGLP
jgi:hypothetical protein